MHRRGRARDEYERFLPREPTNLNKEIKEEDEFPFEDTSPAFPIESSSREKPLETSGLQTFAKILASFLDSTAPNPPIFNNSVPNVPF